MKCMLVLISSISCPPYAAVQVTTLISQVELQLQEIDSIEVKGLDVICM